MDDQTVFNKVREILADFTGLDEDTIKLESNLREDLDLDSLDVIEVVMEIEDHYDVSVGQDFDLTTVKEVVEIFCKTLTIDLVWMSTFSNNT